MRKFITLFFLNFLILSFVLTIKTGGADENTGTYTVTVEKGLISLAAENASLDAILNELNTKTGVTFATRTASLSTDIVSISFQNLTFAEAIGRLLKDYSYVIEEEPQPHIIILASLPSREVSTKDSSTPKVYTVQPGSAATRGVSQVTYQAGERPFDLDECQALEFSEKDANQAISGLQESLHKTDTGKLSKGASEQESRYLQEKMEENRKRLDDEKIKRAQKVLGMERCSNLYEQAIEEISRIQDDRVTAILADTAQSGKTEKLKMKAAQELWHHTADSEFKDTKGIDALKRLSTSSDHMVSDIAQRALRDYERYIRRNE